MAVEVKMVLRGIDQFEKNANKLMKDITAGRTATLLKAAQKGKKRVAQIMAERKYSAQSQGSAYAAAIPERINAPAVAFFGLRPRKIPQGHLIEHGHLGPHPAPPHPIVGKAWDELKEELKQDIAQDTKQTIDASISNMSQSSSFAAAYEKANRG